MTEMMLRVHQEEGVCGDVVGVRQTFASKLEPIPNMKMDDNTCKQPDPFNQWADAPQAWSRAVPGMTELFIGTGYANPNHIVHLYDLPAGVEAKAQAEGGPGVRNGVHVFFAKQVEAEIVFGWSLRSPK